MKNPKYILFVDDEINILNALKREVSDWAEENNLEVMTASSGQKALDLLTSIGEETGILISDLKMPEMKGSDLLAHVRDHYPDIVTILLTGFSETEELVKAVRAGIFSYILKPWDSDYLLTEIKKAWQHGELKRQNAEYLKKMKEELMWAGEMQKALLRPALPETNGVEFRVSYRPVADLYIGGDYYDVISLGQDRYLILLGDVAGHGVRAAFITAILKAVIYPEYIRHARVSEFSPAAFLSWLNDRMNFELRKTSQLLISFFAGLLEMRKGSLKYANAGQCHPCIRRANTILELPVSGSAIGFANSVQYMEQEARIVSGDLLTCYTDGLVELGAGPEQETIKAQDLFSSVPWTADYHRNLLSRAKELGRGKAFTDDVTILTARFL
jgi:sigma-B regulation protein RsbU (phosphoserine phosphatase)